MRPGRFLLGLAFIVIGTVMFMVNLGYTSWSFLGRLVEFWPVLLISFGISLIWGGDVPRWVAIIVVAVIVAGVVFLAINYANPYTGNGPVAFNSRKSLAILPFLL